MCLSAVPLHLLQVAARSSDLAVDTQILTAQVVGVAWRRLILGVLPCICKACLI